MHRHYVGPLTLQTTFLTGGFLVVGFFVVLVAIALVSVVVEFSVVPICAPLNHNVSRRWRGVQQLLTTPDKWSESSDLSTPRILGEFVH